MKEKREKNETPDFANNPIVKQKVDELNAYLKTADLTGLYDDDTPKKPREVTKK